MEWSREKTEMLIAEIEKRPQLYDTTLKSYSNRDMRRKEACEEIGVIIEGTAMITLII
jgi:Alcohol dehydrogenase transcription factor Myb/SANT-like